MYHPGKQPSADMEDEKNEKSKQMIKKKVSEYLERAEKLKDHLNKPSAKDGKPAVASANGVSSGGKGKYGPHFIIGGLTGDRSEDDVDADTQKLRGALSGAILTETPNVKWEDVAGLEGAKETLKEAVILPIKVPTLWSLCMGTNSSSRIYSLECGNRGRGSYFMVPQAQGNPSLPRPLQRKQIPRSSQSVQVI
jgi:SpoVK/Ycf46/Vps4 family AAA+-type ATPase